jgi:hypothetical protein
MNETMDQQHFPSSCGTEGKTWIIYFGTGSNVSQLPTLPHARWQLKDIVVVHALQV